MAANVSLLRWLLLPFILFGFWGGAHAGADPTSTDWLPQFNKVQLEGLGVVFDAGVTQIRLREGKWDNASGSPINTMKEKQNRFSLRSTECSVPQEVLFRSKNGIGPAAVMYCDLPERIWFATRGYCGEGEGKPEHNQGRLYSFLQNSGDVREYPGFLPKCAELAGLERIDNKLVVVTLYQGEYYQSPGQVLIYDLDHVKAPPKVLTNPLQTGAVVGMSKYDKQCDCLWFATLEGIERLTIGNGNWEQRYLDYEISPDNKFLPTLSLKKPSDEKMWLGRVLYNYPIEDLRGFVTAWNHSPATEYDNPRIGPLLLPFYIAAIERSNDGWSDWTFEGLMRIVAAHQDSESNVMVRALIEKLLKQPMNSARHGAVVQLANKLGVSNSHQLMDEQFESLLSDYFTNSGNGSSQRLHRMCDFAFKNVRYISTLNDYYITHVIPNASIESNFLYDCVRAYYMWDGYASLLPTVLKVLTQNNEIENLASMCSIFNHYANPEYRQSRFIFPIINARYKTDRFKDSRKFLASCVTASYWIANSADNINELLNGIDAYPDLSPMAIDVLHQVTGKQFNSIPEWRDWWGSNRKSYRPSKKVFSID